MHLENINGCQRVVASSRPALAPPVDALSTLRVTSSEEQERPLKVPQASVYNAKCTAFKLALPPRQCARIHSPFGEMGFWNTDAQCSTKKGFREGIQPKNSQASGKISFSGGSAPPLITYCSSKGKPSV